MRNAPALLLAALLAACAGARPAPEPSAESIYRQAEKAVAARDTQEAQKFLDRVRDEFPFSRYAVDAELLGADLAFGDQKYEEASTAYRAFEEQHPTHPKALYALFRRGLALRELSRPADRDQTATRGAAEAFQKLLNASPQGEFAADARKYLADARSRLAGHELFVAKFYLGRKQPSAALERLRTVAREYADTPEREEAAGLLRSLEAGGAAKDR